MLFIDMPLDLFYYVNFFSHRECNIDISFLFDMCPFNWINMHKNGEVVTGKAMRATNSAHTRKLCNDQIDDWYIYNVASVIHVWILFQHWFICYINVWMVSFSISRCSHMLLSIWIGRSHFGMCCKYPNHRWNTFRSNFQIDFFLQQISNSHFFPQILNVKLFSEEKIEFAPDYFEWFWWTIRLQYYGKNIYSKGIDFFFELLFV